MMKPLQTSRNEVHLFGGTDSQIKQYYTDTLKFRIDTKTLSQRTSMKHGRTSFGLIQIQRIVLVVGGAQGSNRLLRSCERFNLETNLWSKFPSLSEQSIGPSLLQAKGSFLYCVGSISLGAKHPVSIERIDLASAKFWEKVNLR